MAIPLSRFQKFIANSVISAINARVELMKASPVPIKTGAFVLKLDGQLIDDLGGAGWNEIERVVTSVNPGSDVVTVVTDPASVTVTETIPETTSTTDSAFDSETAAESVQKYSVNTSNQNSSDTATDQARDSSVQVAEQEHGRGVETTTKYTD